jgi:hypothetical protein
VSGADNPRQTGHYRGAVIAARNIIELETPMRGAEADRLAEAIAERLLGDFLAAAEKSSWVAFTPLGTGPVCTWCGAMAGPRIPPGHPQYGIFCTCRRPKDEQPAEVSGG